MAAAVLALDGEQAARAQQHVVDLAAAVAAAAEQDPLVAQGRAQARGGLLLAISCRSG